ncbi:MAG: HD domain-containing protein [Gammaproteobacteria bacterium]
MSLDHIKKREIIEHVENYVRDQMGEDPTGHDWEHVNRVRNVALHIAAKEGGDLFIIELSALLHDMTDHKLVSSAEEGQRRVYDCLNGTELDRVLIDQIYQIVDNVSYSKNPEVADPAENIELCIVQEADRLDAIGAIGIARAFATGAAKFRQLLINSNDVSRSTRGHFDDKLFKLKDTMHTDTAKNMAEERHRFMVEFITHFDQECRYQPENTLDDNLEGKMTDSPPSHFFTTGSS